MKKIFSEAAAVGQATARALNWRYAVRTPRQVTGLKLSAQLGLRGELGAVGVGRQLGCAVQGRAEHPLQNTRAVTLARGGGINLDATFSPAERDTRYVALIRARCPGDVHPPFG